LQGIAVSKSVLFKSLFVTCSLSVLGSVISAHAEDIVISGPQNATVVLDGGDTLTITKDGIIEPPSGDEGVVSTGGNNEVLNNGRVWTEGDSAYGILNSNSNNSPVTNSGTVWTEGDYAVGIFKHGSPNSPITNSGTVHTQGSGSQGDYAFGIYNSKSDYSPVSNSGTVHTEGLGSIGIWNYGSDYSPVTNSGTVWTEGDYAVGIFNSNSDYSQVTNSGRVRTTGIDAYGIYSRDNTNSAVTNRGSVISEQSDAIVMNDVVGVVLNLEAPGFIGGRINFEQPTTVNLKTGPSHSVLWDLSSGKMIGDNPASFSGPVPWFYNDTTKQYATYDPTGLAASVNSLGDMTSLLSMVGRNGLGRVNGPSAPSAPSANGFVSSYLPASPASDADRRIEQAFGDPANVTDSDNAYAADLDTADMSYAAPGRFWITGFGGEMTHDGDSITLDHDITQMGVAAGYTWQQSSGLTLGVMAGYLQSDMDANSRFAPSHDIESQGWFAGLYGEQAMETFTIDFGVNGGMLSHDSSRFVNDNLAPLGVAHAKADYDSWFISPEIGIRTDIDTGNGLIVTPSARVRYAHQSIDGFSESGSNANAKIAGRDIGMIEASAEIAVSKQLSFGTLTGRVGYVSRNSTGDEAVSITMIGINNKVGFGDTDSEAAYVGLSTDIDLSASSKLVLDANAFYSGNMQGYQGMAKLVASF
jgi:hypothetical protein